ncbi:MAG: M24 family metallopeptidase [candidate division Zixibacteria bacterium]|nr:M24 family metallopeptidase [candidate division Zixibacteria bacterium]
MPKKKGFKIIFDLSKIQEYLRNEKLDGWLLADFHCRNNIAVEFLNLPANLTRRFFYFIPAMGQPTALIHNIEKDKFTHLLGNHISFSSYKDLELSLGKILKGCQRIAMEYSPGGRLPYIGLVDAGTIELVRSYGVKIVSSADMVSFFTARMTPEQILMHKNAAFLVNRIKDDAFTYIKRHLSGGIFLNEKMVVDFIKRRFDEENLITDFAPICAVDANISNPHYEPPSDGSAVIARNGLILIDLWAKLNQTDSIFADITWMAYAGESVPDKYRSPFSIVVSARNRAVDYIKEKYPQPVFGYDIDDACRQVIIDAGYGNYFFHRTGHSILESVHGPGPNIDNLETEDRRRLLPGHLFSIEPGIYLEGYGFRSEIDLMLTESGPEITTLPMQIEIIPLLA